MASEVNSSKLQRLNPFAFPSETNARFVLLVASALMLAVDIGLGLGLGTGIVKSPEWNTAFTWFILPCGWPLAVAILATVIYRGHADRIRRAKNLKIMILGDDPKFADAVQEVVNLAGLSPAPSIEVAAESRSLDGQAFGFRNKYTLRLSGRLRLLLRQNPASFKAIVLHELGHIANADVTRAYFAQSIIVAFVILVIIPVLAFTTFSFIDSLAQLFSSGSNTILWIRFFTTVLPTVFLLLLQTLGTLAIVAAIRGSLLRVREMYADWRATLWGAGESLADILRRNPSKPNARRWTYLWQLHPSSEERLAAVKNPVRLFQITNELPFFIGILLGYMLHAALYLSLAIFLPILAGGGGGLQLFINVMNQISNAFSSYFATLNPQTNEMIFNIFIIPIFLIILAILVISIITLFGAGFGLAYFVAGTLGLEVYRESVVNMMGDQRVFSAYFSFWKPATLVAIGSQIGNLLIPYGYMAKATELINFNGLSIVLMAGILTIVNTILVWLWIVYNRFFGQRLLGAQFGKFPPHGARRVLTMMSSGLLLFIYLPILIGVFAIDSLASGQPSNVLIDWMGLIFSTSLLAVFTYGLTFAATWLLVKIYQLFRSHLCPSCEKVTQKPFAVGEVCEHCGSDLAPWLFVNQST